MSSRVILLFAVLTSQVFLAVGCRDKEPVEFVRSGLSDSWPTLTCSEAGFEVKYPPGCHCTQTLWVGMVDFSGGSGHVNIRRFDAATRKQMEALYPGQNPFPSDGRQVKIGDLMAKSGVPGNGYIDFLFIERGSFTYEIRWDVGSASIGEEMAATFRLIDVKHSDYLTYTDPDCGFAFDYPYNWNLDFGGTYGAARIRGGALDIEIEFKAGTSAEDFLHEWGRQVTDAEEVQEHFLHHLMGRRCRLFGDETYLIENQRGTYVVKIQGAPAPGSASRKSVDDFLDSLRL